MAVYFEISIATTDREAADAVARHLSGLDFLGAAPFVGRLRGESCLVSAWVRGLSLGAPTDPEPPLDLFEPEARRRLEALYERLRSAPPFRCACTGAEVQERLTEEEDATLRAGDLVVDGDLLSSVGSVVDAPLLRAMARPDGFEPFRTGLYWRPFMTRSPWAFAFLADRLDAWPAVERVPASELGWDEVPAGAELDRLATPDATLYLHPRSGRWSDLRPAHRAGVAFLGATRDALVFADRAPRRIVDFLARRGGPPRPVAGACDGLAGSALRHPEAVATWGSFADRVLDEHVEHLMGAAPDAVTYVLDAIEAPVGGLRQTVVAHRDGSITGDASSRGAPVP